MKKFKWIALLLNLFIPAMALAAPTPIMSQKFIDALSTTTPGSLTVDLITCMIVQAGKFLFGLVGVFCLVMFVYGGFTFLTSGGSSSRVKDGKTILTNAVIGLVLAFAAYMIIRFVIIAIGSDPAYMNTSFECPI